MRSMSARRALPSCCEVAMVLHFCYTISGRKVMPTTHPRVSAVVERPLYEAIRRLAVRDEVSISEKARDLLLEALELAEDAALEHLVNRRRKQSMRSYSLAEARRRLKLD